jgi:CYTH domain-containing protein
MAREPGEPVEIERKYLLRAAPVIPKGAEVWRIEQGYFTDPIANAIDAADGMADGRLRRATLPDGQVRCTHTVKRGDGLVRTEIERSIDPETFRRHWPRTTGRRLIKTRHRVREGLHLWEIDVFDGLDLALAEVELEDAGQAVRIPAWLEPLIVREVTDDPAFTNAAIASRASAAS